MGRKTEDGKSCRRREKKEKTSNRDQGRVLMEEREKGDYKPLN